MGFDINTSDDEYTGYLSYNHSADRFSKYWYIRKHLANQTGATVLANLKTAIAKLEADGFVPVESLGWKTGDLLAAGFKPPEKLKDKKYWGAYELQQTGFEVSDELMSLCLTCWTTTEPVFMYLLKKMHDEIESIICRWPSHAEAIYTVD